GFDQWRKLFTHRQLVTLGTLVGIVRGIVVTGDFFFEALAAYLAISVDKQVDRSSTQCRWDQGYTKVHSSFARFALPMLWDFAEGSPFSGRTGDWLSCVEWTALYAEHGYKAGEAAPRPSVLCKSALEKSGTAYDLILTDPPYYDAIPYSDLMDFFYVWLRRTLR